MYLVGFLQPYTSPGGEDVKIIFPIQCVDGDDIELAVRALCDAIDYNTNEHFDLDIWDALHDIEYLEQNIATIELYGSNVLLDLIIGKEDVLREKYFVEEPE